MSPELSWVDALAVGLSFLAIMIVAWLVRLVEGRCMDPGNRYGAKYNDWESY